MENELTVDQMINKILYCIDEYIKGNDEYEEDILDIIDAVEDYIKYGKKIYKKYTLIVKLLEFRISILERYMLDDNNYEEFMKYIYDDLAEYKYGIDALKEYIEYCYKENAVYDLDIAYLLTIKLSLILNNISKYMKEINNVSNHYNSFIQYCPRTSIRTEVENNIDEIDKMIKQIKRS